MDGSMEYYTMTLILLTFITMLIVFSRLFSNSRLPPGPFSWPIIGNIHKLSNKPHQAIAELSKIYGPLMSLRLGSITTIVISSPEIAQEMFLRHDLEFSGKVVLDAMTVVNHHKFSIFFLPICPLWRKLRKIVTIQLLTIKRLDASQIIRENKVKELVDYVHQCGKSGIPVDIGKAAFTTTLNLLSNTFFSKDLASHTSSSTQEFKDLVWILLEEAGRPNVSDFFPIVRSLDLQGVFRRETSYLKKMLQIFDEIIDERLTDSNMGAKDDVLSTLLNLVEDQQLSRDEVKHLLVDLFVAGTDASSNTLEWSITDLLRSPQKMVKAKIELDHVFGKGEIIQETDISNLPYVQAIVKETFRLHPPTPFLVPYKAEKNVEFCGYIVPKNAHIWVNVWAIGRDSNVWGNPPMFSPERFLDTQINVKGQDFELIPFGSGRRMCPGMMLADRMVHLMLTNLLHSFDWKFCDGVCSEDDIDMEKKFGLALQKKQSLQAIPLLR